MPHAPDLSGRALDGRYELHAVIGDGTFGRVYRGLDRRLARPVAVKVIKPWWAEDPEWVRNFEREAQLLARVNDPGIVQIFDVGHAREGLYYVAELVEGESLADRLRHGVLPPAQARGIAEQLCRALSRAHAQSVIHRDIKPANVLISADGRVKVGDFGVARLAEGSTDGSGATIVGTPRYMAPEQARGRPTGPATDVYGVGIVLYEMLAGGPPFTEKSAVEVALRHLNDPPPPLPGNTPLALREVVDRALAKKPEDRYRTAAAMADALARVPLPASRSRAARVVPDRQVVAAPTPAEAEATKDMAAGGDETAAVTAVLDPGGEAPAATRARVPTIPRRREDDPRVRRRRLGLPLSLGVALLVAIVAAVLLIVAAGQVKVPGLLGARRASITTKLRREGLKASFGARYDDAPAGSAIAQSPSAGTRVGGGSTVRVVLSRGPAPVAVPPLIGKPGGAARSILGRIGLHGTLAAVPAPGIAAGIVTRESPAAGAKLRLGSSVALQVAEIPRWRFLTSFSGNASGHSVPFRILGKQWRVVYRMNYTGICSYLSLFCSGPSARVVRFPGASPVKQFDLGDGSGQNQVIKSGPGVYQIDVTPGSGAAQWSVQVEDYY